MHVDCIGMRAISMGSILAQNIASGARSEFRHPTLTRVKEPVFGHLRQNPIFWTLYFLFIIISCSNHEANIIII